jgi:hypothetical protein
MKKTMATRTTEDAHERTRARWVIFEGTRMLVSVISGNELDSANPVLSQFEAIYRDCIGTGSSYLFIFELDNEQQRIVPVRTIFQMETIGYDASKAPQPEATLEETLEEPVRAGRPRHYQPEDILSAMSTDNPLSKGEIYEEYRRQVGIKSAMSHRTFSDLWAEMKEQKLMRSVDGWRTWVKA